MDEDRLCMKLEDALTEEDGNVAVETGIRALIGIGIERGLFGQDEASMMKNALDYKSSDAKDVMIHRKHIVGMDESITLRDAVDMVLKTRFSRFPVYRDTIDDIIGTIHIRDLLRSYTRREYRDRPVKDVPGCIRKASFIPETRSLHRLFKQMQTNKKHLAVVIDEYGQTAGIVTLEDIIEEIVGSIQDEYDGDEESLCRIQNGVCLAKGICDLDDLGDILHISFDKEEYETLNGFLIGKLERVPSDGEKASVIYMGYEFYIQSVKDNMIQQVRIERLPV